jgi:hypothetical protein
MTTGATASNRSSICSGQAVGCIDLYMNDANGGGPGFGHRTWIFANSLGPVGFGSVGTGRGMTASCFYQVGGSGHANAMFVAWPPPGPVPLAAITATNVDKAGWSIQSDSVDLTAATATVTDNGTSLAVTVTPNLPRYGAMYAMGIAPNGWTEQAGHSYTVTVGGTKMPITYTIDVVDCSSYTTSGCTGGTGAGGTTGGTGAAGTTGTGAAGTTGTGAAGRGGASGAAGTSATTGAAGTNPTSGAGGSVGNPTGAAGHGASESPATGSGCACAVSRTSAGTCLSGFALLALLAGARRRRHQPGNPGRVPGPSREGLRSASRAPSTRG